MFNKRAIQILDSVPVPDDYFKGASGRYVSPPREILLFTRRNESETMGEGVAMHARFVLCVCIETSGTLMVDGQLLPIKPGQGVLLYPFQQHSFSQFSDDHLFWLFVSFDLSDEKMPALMRGVPFTFTRRERVYLHRMIVAFDAYRKEQWPGAYPIASWLNLLLDALLQRAGGLSPPMEEQSFFDDRLRTVVRYIYAHLDQDLDVSDLAHEVHLSSSHLRRVFRETMGVSLGRFMLGARLNHAASLLQETQLSVSAIADACGFETLYAFSRAFKRGRGESPTQYRSRFR